MFEEFSVGMEAFPETCTVCPLKGFKRHARRLKFLFLCHENPRSLSRIQIQQQPGSGSGFSKMSKFGSETQPLSGGPGHETWRKTPDQDPASGKPNCYLEMG